jgi:hypothetical protein
MNIRDLFAGTRYTYHKRNGVDLERENVEKWQSAFAELIHALFGKPENTDQSTLAQFICTVSTQGVAGGISTAMGNVLASSFYEFAADRKAVAKGVICGSSPMN